MELFWHSDVAFVEQKKAKNIVPRIKHGGENVTLQGCSFSQWAGELCESKWHHEEREVHYDVQENTGGKTAEKKLS